MFRLRRAIHDAARTARRPPFRWVAAPAYRALIRSELAAQRAIDRLVSTPSPDVSDVTVMIKTFERPVAVTRLIESIRRIEPEVAILAVDDSHTPIEHSHARTITLPYDSGVSAGRNAGLAAVETPFFVLADDDFVFFHRTRLGPPLRVLRAHPEIDILGGSVIDLPTYRTVSSRGRRALGADRTEPGPTGTIGGLERREHIRNFFIGRTERVRQVGWDPQLRRVDHADFFGRARGTLTIVEDPSFAVLHAKTPFDAHYMRHREDVARDMALLKLRWAPPPPARGRPR